MTGASSGIGRAFALALGARGLRVILVARDEARLRALAGDIEAKGSSAEVLRADLADPSQVAEVEERLRTNADISLFVNNAGLGFTGPFADVEVDAAETQIRVNVLAATRLAHAAIQGMRKRGRGALVNVSSGAAFVPSLYNGAYSGTKAYLAVLSFTMTEELRGSGIDVVTVLPGFTRTEFQQRANFDVSTLPGFVWQDASEVVDASLAALQSGDPVCVPGVQNKVALALNHLVPYSKMGRLAGLMSRFLP